MHPDKRRAGRRIRKQRRTFRRIGEQFGRLGKAASVAAIAFGSFATAIQAAIKREEEWAREAVLASPPEGQEAE